MLLGMLRPDITTLTLTARSVTVSWIQPPFSFTPVGYTATLTRITNLGAGQVLCNDVSDDRPSVGILGTSVDFSDLEEFSTYRVTITASFNVFNTLHRIPASLDFITLSTGA